VIGSARLLILKGFGARRRGEAAAGQRARPRPRPIPAPASPLLLRLPQTLQEFPMKISSSSEDVGNLAGGSRLGRLMRRCFTRSKPFRR
jgi:hypothetical protein